MTALLIDLDGVIYEAAEPVPGAAEAIAWLGDTAIPHLYLTNTTSRPRRALVEKLSGTSIAVEMAGAHSAGLSAVLVRTGKFLSSDLGGDIVPEFVFDSFAELPRRWPEMARSLK